MSTLQNSADSVLQWHNRLTSRTYNSSFPIFIWVIYAEIVSVFPHLEQFFIIIIIFFF